MNECDSERNSEGGTGFSKGWQGCPKENFVNKFSLTTGFHNLFHPLYCKVIGEYVFIESHLYNKQWVCMAVTNVLCGFSQRLIYGALIHNQTLRVCLALNSICSLVCD